MTEDTNWFREKMMSIDIGSTYKQRKYRKSPSPTQHPTKTCLGILKLCREAGYDLPGPDENYRISRVRAGHHQRSAGAWSWSLMWDISIAPIPSGDACGQIGSRWPASDCVKQGVTFDKGIGYGIEMIPKGAFRW